MKIDTCIGNSRQDKIWKHEEIDLKIKAGLKPYFKKKRINFSFINLYG